MPKDLYRALSLSVCCLTFCGCGFVPQWQVRQSQLAAYRFYGQSQQLVGELGQAQMLASQLQSENQTLVQNLEIANQRLANMAQERSQLHEQYRHLLTSMPAPGGPLNGSTSGRFEDLARRYPEFEFDPQTGISRFNNNLLFDSGSDVINPQGMNVLREFAEIMNTADARQFNIQVVGHTDDQNIVRPATRARHETNWDLSAHRATAVVKALSGMGIAEPRMGIAGFSKHQPQSPNYDDRSRQQNRRVEIYVLAPDATIAGRDHAIRR